MAWLSQLETSGVKVVKSNVTPRGEVTRCLMQRVLGIMIS